MLDDPLMEMRKVARNGPQDANMLSRVDEGDGFITDVYGGDCLDILDVVCLVF